MKAADGAVVPAEIFCHNSLICHIWPWGHKHTEHSQCPSLEASHTRPRPAEVDLSSPTFFCTCTERQTQADTPRPAIIQHSADTSPALATGLMPSNTDTWQRLLAEAGRTVSVKWEQRFLRNHHLINEGWWSSSCRVHYFWWGSDKLRDNICVKHQTHLKHTQTL